MFRCHICGSTDAKTEYVNEIFYVHNKSVIVEHIPATVCMRCGDESFSRETTEYIRKMIHGDAKPVRSVLTDVFVFGTDRTVTEGLHI